MNAEPLDLTAEERKSIPRIVQKADARCSGCGKALGSSDYAYSKFGETRLFCASCGWPKEKTP